MTKWIIFIAILLASFIGIVIADRFARRRSKAGIFLWVAMVGLSAAIISGFLIQEFAPAGENDDIFTRVSLGSIPSVLFIIAGAGIWITAQRDLDEMTEMIRNRGVAIGAFIVMLFFGCYGSMQLAGVPLPDLSGFNALWIMFPCMLLPQLLLSWKYR